MESSCGSIIEILMQLHLECGHIVIFLKEKLMTHILSSIQYTHWKGANRWDEKWTGFSGTTTNCSLHFRSFFSHLLFKHSQSNEQSVVAFWLNSQNYMHHFYSNQRYVLKSPPQACLDGGHLPWWKYR
jgi:hypothetical protein